MEMTFNTNVKVLTETQAKQIYKWDDSGEYDNNTILAKGDFIGILFTNGDQSYIELFLGDGATSITALQKIIIQNLSQLSDVDLSETVVEGELLYYDGNGWTNGNKVKNIELLNGGTITGLSTPTTNDSAANKNYVDTEILKLKIKKITDEEIQSQKEFYLVWDPAQNLFVPKEFGENINLSELSDVSIKNPLNDKDLLMYNGSNNCWENSGQNVEQVITSAVEAAIARGGFNIPVASPYIIGGIKIPESQSPFLINEQSALTLRYDDFNCPVLYDTYLNKMWNIDQAIQTNTTSIMNQGEKFDNLNTLINTNESGKFLEFNPINEKYNLSKIIVSFTDESLPDQEFYLINPESVNKKEE